MSIKICCKNANDITFEHASFGVIGSISLHGIRKLKPEIGETVVVYGLGLIGLIAVQILRSSGINVIAIDIDDSKLKLAESFGANIINPISSNLIDKVMSQTSNIGCDAVLICASAETNEIIENSSEILRKKGRIVLIGVVGLSLNRDIFYKKEIDFSVSCSYGPGRYDYDYEVKGIDYPISYVRWTEKRNFETVLKLISDNKLDVNQLISKKVDFENSPKIFERLVNDNSLGILINYNQKNQNENLRSKVIQKNIKKTTSGNLIGAIGAGNHFSRKILPYLPKDNLQGICSSSSLSASIIAKKYSIPFITSDANELISNKDINTVIITTPHSSHFQQIKRCIAAKKYFL